MFYFVFCFFIQVQMINREQFKTDVDWPSPFETWQYDFPLLRLFFHIQQWKNELQSQTDTRTHTHQLRSSPSLSVPRRTLRICWKNEGRNNRFKPVVKITWHKMVERDQYSIRDEVHTKFRFFCRFRIFLPNTGRAMSSTNEQRPKTTTD